MNVRDPLGATPDGGAFELTTSALERRTSLSGTRSGLLGVGGVLLTGLVISVSASNTDSLLPESARPIPAWLAGPFGSSGLGIGHAGVIVVLAMMFASYALAVRGADRVPARVLLMAIAGLHALVLLAPPLLSTDIFSYGAYGRMAAQYGANPYLQGPHAIALDPLFPFVGAKWSYAPTAYGPLFTALSYPLAGLGIATSAIAYKTIAALASLATVGLVWNAARLRGLDPVKAAVLVGLNPLIVVYGVGGGHNDLLMLAALTGAVYMMLQQRERAGGALMVAAALGIKLSAGLLAPFAAAGAIKGGPGVRRHRRDLLIGGSGAAAVVVVIGLAMFGTGPLHLFSTLYKSQTSGDWHSIPGFISTGLGLGDVGHLAGVGLAVLFVLVLGWLLRRVWRGQLDWIAGAGWATVALLITASSLLPWYVAWLIPLAALGADSRLYLTAVVITGFVGCIQLLGYIPHAASLLGR